MRTFLGIVGIVIVCIVIFFPFVSKREKTEVVDIYVAIWNLRNASNDVVPPSITKLEDGKIHIQRTIETKDYSYTVVIEGKLHRPTTKHSRINARYLKKFIQAPRVELIQSDNRMQFIQSLIFVMDTNLDGIVDKGTTSPLDKGLIGPQNRNWLDHKKLLQHTYKTGIDDLAKYFEI